MRIRMRPYLTAISLTEARRRLSSILREIEADPDVGYEITVRNKVVAQLRRPEPKINSGAALLKAARMMEKLHPRDPGQAYRNTAANYKEYLYGKKQPGSARRHR